VVEKKNFIKELLGNGGLLSIVRSLMVVTISLSLSIPAISAMVKAEIKDTVTEAVSNELAPIRMQIINDLISRIDKNIEKIKNDPQDLKIADIVFIVDSWDALKSYEMPGKPAIENKIRMLQQSVNIN